MNASFLFEAASRADIIANRVKQTRVGRGIWGDEINSALIEVFLCKQPFSEALINANEAEGDDPTEAFSAEVLGKLDNFLTQVKGRLKSMGLDYHTKRTFLSKLVNMVFKSLGVSIEGPGLDKSIRGVGTDFNRKFVGTDPEQAEYRRKRMEFYRDKHGVPEEDAWKMVDRDWKNAPAQDAKVRASTLRSIAQKVLAKMQTGRAKNPEAMKKNLSKWLQKFKGATPEQADKIAIELLGPTIV